MKYLKLYENFQEEDIHKLCKKYSITNYTINKDGTIDVDGDVDLSDCALHNLPLQFNRVNGNFNCGANGLSNLKGCPVYVRGFFDCSVNNLTSLEGCPKEVGGSFYCNYNSLKSLIGLPDVGDEIFSEENDFQVIHSLFPDEESFINSLDYDYFRGGNKINKIRLTQALAELDLKCPENIEGYIWE